MTTIKAAPAAAIPSANSRSRVIVASLIGTTIEFYDFYVYATAAVLVFPKLFFPNADATTQLLSSFAVFGVAFIARPLGSILFGHFGDKFGRKGTLVASLLTMGIATFLIGCLPTAQVPGWSFWAPALLVRAAVCPGPGPGRGMERRGAAGHGERARQQARHLRHLPADGRPDRLHHRQRALPDPESAPCLPQTLPPGAGACRSCSAP